MAGHVHKSGIRDEPIVVNVTVVGPALPGVATIEIDGRFVVLSADRDNALFLNETASDVWRLADGNRTFDELVAELAAAYSTTPDAITNDIRQALLSFCEAGLIADPV